MLGPWAEGSADQADPVDGDALAGAEQQGLGGVVALPLGAGGAEINRFTGTSGSSSALLGGIANFSALLGTRSRISLNNTYNRTADNTALLHRVLRLPADRSNRPQNRAARLRKDSRPVLEAKIGLSDGRQIGKCSPRLTNAGW